MAASLPGRLQDTEEGHRGQRQGEGRDPEDPPGSVCTRERAAVAPLDRQGPEAVTSQPTTLETTKLVLKANEWPNFKIGHPPAWISG